MHLTQADISGDMAKVASDIAFSLALVGEDAAAKMIKLLRKEFNSSYLELFPDASSEEGDRIAKDVLTKAVIQKHEYERYGSVVSRAIH